jgi:RimJ/RimL family protein N-acetyltransferase
MKARFTWLSELPAERWPQLVALYNEVIATEDILGYQQALSAAEGAAIAEGLARSIREGSVEFLAIDDDATGRLIGMALLGSNKLPNCAHRAELSKGIIAPAYRGHGVMELALLSIAEHCIERQIDLIHIDVRQNSRSHRLWAKVGFQQYGILEDYARTAKGRFAGVYMFIESRTLLRSMVDRQREKSDRKIVAEESQT